MLELILLVLFFVSSPFSEYAVLTIIVVYGASDLYLRVYRPDVWRTIRDGEDRRRAAAWQRCVDLGRHIIAWIVPHQQ
jgi:hypothetical protein